MTNLKIQFLRALLLASALSSAVMTPAAFAETVSVTVMNTRGEDGIYRAALRVIRNGTVVFYPAGEAGLTEEMIHNSAALNVWLGANLPAVNGNDPVSIVVEEIQSRPAPAEETDPGDDNTDDNGCCQPSNQNIGQVNPNCCP